MKASNIILPLLVVLLLAACSYSPKVPDGATPVSEQANIYPDYRDVTVPPNIAPLNVQIKNDGTEYAVALSCGNEQIVGGTDREDGVVAFDSVAWHRLLQTARGKDIRVSVYARRDGGWVAFPAYTISVAAEPIDRYLSYRLIEPSYELYRQMGLYQRDLESFSVTTIYENNNTYDLANNHCVNCHNYQNYSTRRMLFHVRAKHGGTVFIHDGKAEKRQMKGDSILAGATYPAWHPTRNWVVFSSNQTGQTFHLNNRQKIEVVDYGSDLLFYDADKGQLTNILKTDTDLETFPHWAPDGRTLYYCSAYIPQFKGKDEAQRRDIISVLSDSIRYNVMSISFDPQTRTFGTPHVEVDCAAMGKSAAVPRVSPDGRYLLFTLADYGQFHIWHPTADLYLKDLQTGEVRTLGKANSNDADSYHTWSSNGRWIVMASRRDDGSYSRPYIAYFDHHGQSHKAFLLPQRTPLQNILLPKSYNVPELTRDAVTTTAEALREAIYKD